MEQLSFTSAQLVQVIVITVSLVVAVILLLRQILANKGSEEVKEKHRISKGVITLASRNKYPEADAFRMRGVMLKAGLAIALLITVLAFNWTTYEEEVFIPDDPFGADDDIIEIPPRTIDPPPLPPPPPPPPEIVEVPDDEEIKEETVFEDTSIEVEEEIPPPPRPVKKEPPPPPPPSPPPLSPDVDEIFLVVEQMPRFPGCDNLEGKEAIKQCSDSKLIKFLYKHLKYPAIARENGIQGDVVVKFIVAKDGSVEGVQLLRDIGGQCGAEGLRVVNLMNSMGKIWTPGKQRGKAVKVQFTLPIKFRLN